MAFVWLLHPRPPCLTLKATLSIAPSHPARSDRCSPSVWHACAFFCSSRQPQLAPQPIALKVPNAETYPPGAFAGIGALRFRVNGPVNGARFVDGGKSLLLWVCEPPTGINSGNGATSLRLIDLDTGFELGRTALGPLRISGSGPDAGSIADGIGLTHWCLSPDARLLAKIDFFEHSTWQLRDLVTGKVIFDVNDPAVEFSFVQFSPDGKQIAAVAMARAKAAAKDSKAPVVIRLYDLQSRQVIRTFAPPAGIKEPFQARWCVFSPNGAYLAATGFQDGKSGMARVWDVAGKNPSWQLEGQTEKSSQARAIAFSPDSKTVAAVHDGKIRLWDAATGKRLKDLADADGFCETLDFFPDGTRLMAGFTGCVRNAGPYHPPRNCIACDDSWQLRFFR